SEKRRTDLRKVVHRALALVEGRARRQKVKVTADLPPGPVEREIDGEQIHQVLLNLLLNALDALPQGGEVRLEGGAAARPRAGAGGRCASGRTAPGSRSGSPAGCSSRSSAARKRGWVWACRSAGGWLRLMVGRLRGRIRRREARCLSLCCRHKLRSLEEENAK